MWTNENRAKYKRDHLRYPSDLTDEEWAHVEPLIPPARRGGRKRETNMREALNAIMYVLSTGCQWRYLPRDLPPRSTVYRYFCVWADGPLDRVHNDFYEKCRKQAERGPLNRRHHRQPERERRGKRRASIDPHGFDAGKKIKGKKRHLLVDIQGLLMQAIVHSADVVQDRDGGALLLSTLLGRFPYLEKLFADSAAYQGPIFAAEVSKILSRVKVKIVKRSGHAKGFAALPKRCIVQRTIAWLNRCRRLAKDWENLQPHSPHLPSFRLHPP